MPKKAASRPLSAAAQAVLERAEIISRRRNLRLTALRRDALQLLLAADGPCKAYTLLQKLKLNHQKNQPTAIYRALNFLLENGFAHKIHSGNAYIACAHPGEHRECFFMICRRCGDVDECCGGQAGAAIAQTAKKRRFHAARTVVEIWGECGQCVSG